MTECEFCDDEQSVWDDAAGCWFDCVCIEPDQNRLTELQETSHGMRETP